MSKRDERTVLKLRLRRSPNRNFEDRYYTDKEFHRCVLKLRHPNWLSAILHIRRLKQERPLAHMKIYECEFCGWLHITTGRSDKDYFKLQQSLGHLEQLRKQPGYIAKAPFWVQMKDTQLLNDLKTRLRELEKQQTKS